MLFRSHTIIISGQCDYVSKGYSIIEYFVSEVSKRRFGLSLQYFSEENTVRMSRFFATWVCVRKKTLTKKKALRCA